ncbi:MAG: HD domain-containing phosphohydrolase [Hyphomicrobiales bacterium]
MSENARVLIVDDDERLLNAIKRTLRKDFDLTVALGAQEALKILKTSKPFEVVVSDQNMPDMKGVDFLNEVEKKWPSVVRIMLTGNNDQDTAASAINTGKIFRFLTKPCEQKTLAAAINDGVNHHHLLMAEKRLLQHTLAGCIKALTDMLALAKPDIFHRSSDIRRWAEKVADHLEINKTWELDLAAMFSYLGYVTIPDHLIRKHLFLAPLEEDEQKLIREAPGVARGFIQNIPKMEAVSEIVYYSRKGFDGTGYPYENRWGEDLPITSRILNALLTLSDLTVPDNPSFDIAFARLKKHEERYDPKILKTIEKVLHDDEAFSSHTEKETAATG